MYRSSYRFTKAPPKHTDLPAIEATIVKNIKPPVPENVPVKIPYSVRDQHIYVAGKTRHGKTTLLYSIIAQDIANGAGVCVLDPKPCGESPNLVEMVLQHIPAEREGDVIYFNASDPLPLDVMSWETEQERQWVAGDLMKTFMQFLAQKEGDRWPTILRFVIHALLAAKSESYLDIHDFLADEHGARRRILQRIDPQRYAQLLKFWELFPTTYPKDAITPIIARMGTFVLVPPLTKMLSPAKRLLNLEEVIRQRKVLLVDLSGAGEEAGQFIGILLVSRIQQAIFRSLRTNFYLFADEFQNFQTSAFDKILSEAGGLGLRLTLANQYVGQMEERIRKSVFGNVASYFVFRIGSEDTAYFKDVMPTDVKHEQLARQPKYQALYAIAGRRAEFKAIPLPPEPPTEDEIQRAQSIKERTFREYARHTPENRYSSTDEPPDPPRSDNAGDGRGVATPRGVFRADAEAPGGAPQKPRGQKRPEDRASKPRPTPSRGTR
jgi:hypothetical protein